MMANFLIRILINHFMQNQDSFVEAVENSSSFVISSLDNSAEFG